MSECRRTAERLAAYTDASLPPAERDEVERHLSACPPCRDDASQQSGAHAVLRARADRLRAETLPPGLRSRCEALAREHAALPPARSWATRLVPVTLAAILLVFTGAAIVSLATQRSDALFAAQLTADHTRCFRQHVGAAAPGLDAAQVEARLAQDYGWRLHVPASLPNDEVRLVHARRCLYADGRIPHVLYRANGEDLSLFVIEGVARRPADVTAFGHRSRIWTRGDTTFVLVSATSGANLDAAARYLMQEAR
jgi:anti-sigma factor RsiW